MSQKFVESMKNLIDSLIEDNKKIDFSKDTYRFSFTFKKDEESYNVNHIFLGTEPTVKIFEEIVKNGTKEMASKSERKDGSKRHKRLIYQNGQKSRRGQKGRRNKG